RVDTPLIARDLSVLPVAARPREALLTVKSDAMAVPLPPRVSLPSLIFVGPVRVLIPFNRMVPEPVLVSGAVANPPLLAMAELMSRSTPDGVEPWATFMVRPAGCRIDNRAPLTVEVTGDASELRPEVV